MAGAAGTAATGGGGGSGGVAVRSGAKDFSCGPPRLTGAFGGGGGGTGTGGKLLSPPAPLAPAAAFSGASFFASMDCTMALLTSSSVDPKMSGRVRASMRTFVATSSSLAMVLSLSLAIIASFCTFHLGSMSEMRMCSAMSFTATSSPVMGDTANFTASDPPAALALASSANTSGFL